MQIGIIGYGRFGQLLAHYLARDFSVQIFDAQNDRFPERSPELKVAADLKNICQNPVLILAIPISQLEDLLRNIRDYLQPDTILIDVCSVKEKPVEWMLRWSPPEVQILGTHPMFGPDSAAQSLAGKKIVLCKTRITQSQYDQICHYLQRCGLQIIAKTPAQHDREIATSQGLTHFIGRALIDLSAKPQETDTEGYRRLIKILEVVQNDSWELFRDMNRYNRFAGPVRESFQRSLAAVNRKLQKQ